MGRISTIGKINRILSYYTGIYLGKPIGITFDITDRCQLRCTTCIKWKTPLEAQRKELSAEEWKFIILRLKQWLGEFHFIFAGGEPFLRKDIFEIISFAAENNVHSSIISNGYGFSHLAERVVKSKLESLIISLNGMTPHTHDFTRGIKGAYHETLNFIKEVNRYRKNLGRKLRLIISTILMPFNCEEVAGLVRWVRDEGIDGVHFQPLDSSHFFHPYPFPGMISIQMQNYRENYKMSLTGKLDKMINHVIDDLIAYKERGYPINNSINSLKKIKNFYCNNGIMNIKCKIGISRFNIDPYGNVRFCFNMKPIGNILNTSPKKLYNNLEAVRQRRLIGRCKDPCHWLID